ncbi:hypothetical protein [Croceimicrobium hydrocarbonivorans]|uniref:Uncharacterized protein n=1 Tax=Croceimicrobium hydrocarbonivorans TaxID=2761580 RepID=A0A7H0VAT7_9FLAO|nr:hypothetical protein [Croceimicrobium hydrocarbonivorans]QNR22835.1 hypothetical protein H4K34_10630 [Croceimicrobium hydrocarbonivorans]
MNMGVDLVKALERERRREEQKNPDETLAAFKRLLAEDDALETEILENLKALGNSKLNSDLDFSQLDPDRIYSLEQIKSLCTRYRLRFLDAAYFKGEIPYEAIQKIKALQKEQKQSLQGFKLIAPAPMFELKNKDKDPLLMLPISQNHYYLVHKWGNDLHPLRALLVFPFRSFQSLLLSVALLAAFIVSLFPDSVVMGPLDEHSWNIRIIFFFYLFLAFSAFSALYGFSRMKNFNSELWNSRYMD